MIDLNPSAVPENLAAFFHEHPKVALAFSGGTDSAYLLYAARASGCDVRAYYAQSAFQPAFERADALRLAEELGAELRLIPLDVLSVDAVRVNPPDRCYHCKRSIFGALTEAARSDGYHVIIDGTNASDDAGDRPGMCALRELKVLSPLRLCGIGKPRIRELSRQAGLFTWNKPAYACLATRVPSGTPIDRETLEGVEQAESRLFALGFTDFRCRVFHGAARLQFPSSQMERATAMRHEIREALKPWFEIILIDTEDRG